MLDAGVVFNLNKQYSYENWSSFQGDDYISPEGGRERKLMRWKMKLKKKGKLGEKGTKRRGKVWGEKGSHRKMGMGKERIGKIIKII